MSEKRRYPGSPLPDFINDWLRRTVPTVAPTEVMDDPPPKPHEMSADLVAFKLHAINFAEAGDSSPAFYANVEMPDGRTAWDWICDWPELRAKVFIAITPDTTERTPNDRQPT